MGDDARRYLFFVNIQLELDLHLYNGNDTKICKIKTEIHREKKGGFRCLAFNNNIHGTYGSGTTPSKA